MPGLLIPLCSGIPTFGPRYSLAQTHGRFQKLVPQKDESYPSLLCCETSKLTGGAPQCRWQSKALNLY